MNNIFQIVEMATCSGLYPDTSIPEWLLHFSSLNKKGHLETIEKEGEVVCWLTWIRSDKVHTEIPKFLDNIDEGEYIEIIGTQVKDGENGRKLLKQIREKLIKDNPLATHFAWHRARTNYKPKIFKINRNEKKENKI